MNVLVIDDDLGILELLSTLVGMLPGCVPVCYSNSVEALEWCRHNPCDLVLVDSRMPPPDGTEFIRRFRGMDGAAEVPVVMITGEGGRDLRLNALRVGASDFLTKPLDQGEFLARATNLLALRRSQRQMADRAGWLAGEVLKATSELRAREQEVILRLSRAAEFREGESGGHLIRVALISKLIAKNLGLSVCDQDLLLGAAPMHDIGKIAMPDRILRKPASLTPEEWEVIKSHTTVGHQILRGSTSELLQVASIVALSHHERYDGAGYPAGLKGEAIPLYARIVAVADTFDSMLSPRPYREAWDIERVGEFLCTCLGTQLDASCTDALMRGWEEAQEIRLRTVDDVWSTKRCDAEAYGGNVLVESFRMNSMRQVCAAS